MRLGSMQGDGGREASSGSVVARRGGVEARAPATGLARAEEIGYYYKSFPAIPEHEGFRFMANSAQARKRARQAEVSRQHNASLKSMLRTAVKKVRKAIASGDKAAATAQLQASQSVIDRIADKKVVHKNAASRTKARLAQAIKALA